ncbi:hypothetical protein B2M95_15065 [Listeria monocytogenes]|nr:hypothetical protein [Listeria monocytogenes]EAE8821423.1 hypothetical protein [Listeria monocytogenes]EAE8827379.1 hypothetical protein [Listeria monocytogenes]EAG2644358.1 hypothetical protein [Listeria monocytogenes]HAC1997287.1 hypothetical protein [Listeria monocytogenes]
MVDTQMDVLKEAYLRYLEKEFGDTDSFDIAQPLSETPTFGIIHTPISCCDIVPTICPLDIEIVVSIHYRTDNEMLYITAYGNKMEVTRYIYCPIHQMIGNFNSWVSQDFIYHFTGRAFYADFIMGDIIY